LDGVPPRLHGYLFTQAMPNFDSMSPTENGVPSVEQPDSTMSPRDLTVIVAATSKMGIGRGQTLPWTGLKQEMAYFARVTKRTSPGVRVFRHR
jgi:hypothetical protein